MLHWSYLSGKDRRPAREEGPKKSPNRPKGLGGPGADQAGTNPYKVLKGIVHLSPVFFYPDLRDPHGGYMDTQQTEKTPQQAYVGMLYHELQLEHGIHLTRDQFAYHVKRFRTILEDQSATHAECRNVVERIVERLPHFAKMDAVYALQDIRRDASASGASEPAPESQPQINQDDTEPINWSLIDAAAQRAFGELDDTALAERADTGDSWARHEIKRRERES